MKDMPGWLPAPTNLICPGCKVGIDLMKTPFVETQQPNPGDLTVCLKCGIPSRYNDDMTLRLIGPEEWTTFSPKELRELELVLDGVRHVRRTHEQRKENSK
jgi:hypothetical protein